jgi:organic hydroperoxide reductase OsmC/OhrA
VTGVQTCALPILVAGHGHNIDQLHHKAQELCFIAASVNFPVRHEPSSIELGPL